MATSLPTTRHAGDKSDRYTLALDLLNGKTPAEVYAERTVCSYRAVTQSDWEGLSNHATKDSVS